MEVSMSDIGRAMMALDAAFEKDSVQGAKKSIKNGAPTKTEFYHVLQNAARKGATRCVRWLIRVCSDIDRQDIIDAIDGALSMVKWNYEDRVSVVKALVAEMDRKGYSVPERCCIYSCEGTTDVRVQKTLFKSIKEQPAMQDCLLSAVRYNQVGLVKYILQKVKLNDHYLADKVAKIALQQGHTDVAAILEKKGAPIQFYREDDDSLWQYGRV